MIFGTACYIFVHFVNPKSCVTKTNPCWISCQLWFSNTTMVCCHHPIWSRVRKLLCTYIDFKMKFSRWGKLVSSWDLVVLEFAMLLKNKQMPNRMFLLYHIYCIIMCYYDLTTFIDSGIYTLPSSGTYPTSKHAVVGYSGCLGVSVLGRPWLR